LDGKKTMENIYANLGLSFQEVELLKKYKLTYLLDKIQEQQYQLAEHEKQLEKALSKIEKDLNAAREAQMNLLPKELLGVPQIEFKARFYPSLYVSGDTYNVFRLDENHIGVYHIDIAGHGVPAALFSVSLSQLLNTNISKKNLLKVPVKEPPYYKINPPNKVIEMLNEDHSFEQNGIYFTMLYMIINMQTNTISYTRAGHNPPILIRKSGEVEMHDDGGFPVGWDFPREDGLVELEVEPGDRLFMYSDGITEATDAGDHLFGTDRLVQILLENRNLSLDQTLDQVIAGLQEFSGRIAFDDDVSILGLAWK